MSKHTLVKPISSIPLRKIPVTPVLYLLPATGSMHKVVVKLSRDNHESKAMSATFIPCRLEDVCGDPRSGSLKRRI